MKDERIKKLESESENAYISRMYQIKSELNLTNKEVAQLINIELGTSYAESSLRGVAKYYANGFDEGYEEALLKLKGEKVLTESKEKSELEKELKLLKLENENYKQVKAFKEVTEIKNDGSYSSEKLIGIENEEQLKDEAFLLKVHGYDEKSWTIVSARNSIWNAQLKGGKVTKLYASKINVKPRNNEISIEEMKKWFDDFDRKHTTIKNRTYKNENLNSDLLFELPVVDLHYGKKGYSFEIGKDSNSKLTEENFFKVILDYKERLKDKKISKIVFPIGNDLYNSDTIDGSTTRGTKQDNDMRWKEMFKKGMEMIIEGIEILSTIAPVDVIYVEGNHDTMTSFYLLMVLSSHFRKDDDINVIENVQTRQYYQWGKCLIGYAHGDCEKNRIGKLMQIEVPKMWGETKFREWHLAHLHHESSKEDGGMVIRHLPTIMGGDAWHSKEGWIGQLQRCQAFLWDKNRGVLDIMFSQI